MFCYAKQAFAQPKCKFFIFISVILINSKFNLKIFLNLIFHPSGNTRIGEIVYVHAGGKENVGRGWCTRALCKGRRLDHSEVSPTSLIATTDYEDSVAEPLSEEEG